MNTKTLEYIIAVHETQSFGLAAEKCFVSQPALSMQIKKFEEYLDIQIFERSNKTIFTTNIGEKVIKQAMKIIDETHNLNKLVSMHNNKGKVNISIGAFPTLCPYIMPNILPSIKQQMPNISISIIEEKTDNLINMLDNGRLDFALLAEPIDDKRFIKKHLFKDDFYLAVSETNPLAKQKDINIADILNQNLMLLDDGHCLRDQSLEICSLHNINYDNFRGSSLETLRQMVSINEGITFIPKIACTPTKGIKYIKIKGNEFHRNICLVMRKSSVYKDVLEELTKTINLYPS